MTDMIMFGTSMALFQLRPATTPGEYAVFRHREYGWEHIVTATFVGCMTLAGIRKRFPFDAYRPDSSCVWKIPNDGQPIETDVGPDAVQGMWMILETVDFRYILPVWTTVARFP